MAPKRNIGAFIVVVLVLAGTALFVWLGLRDTKTAGPKQERIAARPPIDAPVNTPVNPGQPPAEPAGPAIRGVLKGVDGKPPTNGRVLVASTYERLNVTAALQDASAGYRTHPDGRFAVPLPRADWVLIAFDDEGFVDVAHSHFKDGQDLQLRRWARVEGIVSEAGKPLDGAEITLSINRKGLPNYFYYYEFERRTRTDAAGRYAFDRVPPRTNSLVWSHRGRVPYARHGVGFDIEPGETRTFNFGGSGRPVVAKIETVGSPAPLMFRGTVWPLDLDVAGDWEAMDHDQRQKIARTWMNSNAGQQALNLAYPMAFEADLDGNLRLEDVPPGFYRVVIVGTEVDMRGAAALSSTERFIHVPPGPADEPVSMGTIQAAVKMRVAPGTPAPEIVATGEDGSELKLSSFKGRHVLLVLWAKGKPPHDVAVLRAIRDHYGDDPRLALLELIADDRPAHPRMDGWTRGKVEMKALAPEYTGAAFTAYVIGPDGAFAAWELAGRLVYGAIDQHLRPHASQDGLARVVHNHIAQREGNGFSFKDVPSPAKTDLGTSATWTIVDGPKDRGPIGALHDGEVPDRPDDPTRNLSFSFNALEGRIRADLGAVRTVRQVNSYAWHPGNRGSQVYRLYGADGSAEGFNAEPKVGTDPAKVGWRLIANVDTRGPDGAVGGQSGVSIGDAAKPLGEFRYLLFVPFSTGIRDGWEIPFFSEIDVVGE